MKYLIVIEPTSTGFSSYSPDLPGCISTGSTREECEANMREAVEFHVEGLRAEGDTVPQAGSSVATVEVAGASACRVPCPRLRGHAIASAVKLPFEPSSVPLHAHASVGMAPG